MAASAAPAASNHSTAISNLCSMAPPAVDGRRGPATPATRHDGISHPGRKGHLRRVRATHVNQNFARAFTRRAGLLVAQNGDYTRRDARPRSIVARMLARD